MPTPDQRRAFGQRLRALREAAGIRSQRELAEMLGVTPQNVGGWERGEWAPETADEVHRVDEAVRGHGQLLAELGYVLGESPDERIDQLEAEVAELKRIVAEIVAHPPRRRGRAPE